MVSQFNSQFSALTSLGRGVQAKQTALQSRVDGIEDDHESGSARWNGVIESVESPGGKPERHKNYTRLIESSVARGHRRYRESGQGAPPGSDHRTGSEGAGGLDPMNESVATYGHG